MKFITSGIEPINKLVSVLATHMMQMNYSPTEISLDLGKDTASSLKYKVHGTFNSSDSAATLVKHFIVSGTVSSVPDHVT